MALFEENAEIRPINVETVHKICSGQVVLSLAIAMKELVENSVDAEASIIDIHLKNYGSEVLEVLDNGVGIHRDNLELLTKKHYTSKLRKFSDLENIGTLGFRGEAMSSLCALSDVTVTSKHASTELGTRVQYDRNGIIIQQESTARQQGTTVSIKNLFSSLPVRRKEFLKNLKKEFTKMCTLLYAYCLIPNGIKFTCTNVTENGTKSTIVATEGNKTVRENIISVFGVKQLSSLIDVELVVPEEPILKEYALVLAPGEKLPFDFQFLVSSVMHGSGRSSADRQFYYINSRPCEPSKLMKLVNEIYRQFNNKQYPFVYLNVTTKTALVDVNITPDKRQVFIEKEKLLLAVVKASLVEGFKHFPSTYVMQNLDAVGSKRGIKRNMTDGQLKVVSILDKFKKKSKSEEAGGSTGRENDFESDLVEQVDKSLDSFVNIACKLTKEDCTENLVSLTSEKNVEVTLDSPSQYVKNRKEVPLKLNMDFFKKRFKNGSGAPAEQEVKVKFRLGIDPGNNKGAEDELNRHITKNDFKNMEVIGQFNMGFIVTKLNDDLFIVDQHATDEKYNFELLQANKTMKSQIMVKPKLLELTAASKTTLIEREDVFKKNGFTFSIETDSEEKNVYLTSVPISDKFVFGKSDIDEMIFMMQEDSSRSMYRPMRVRALFASKACRKSVMIGQILSKSDMRKLVDHMGEINQPWNCPHGRPTMRHLVNLKLLL
ncbi:mismatch repair endonuclease PMS2 isoform X2 [Cylas formicarius]|uniref:mismatch repair endonuclease PMS2 isoform X2 n=1 Tax=Cylas formicarius TaxID=197179 RepID=UPI00295869F5|nr:mismatch repair endonuclease PMS2 isoform X2 [Cylas formicarius]